MTEHTDLLAASRASGGNRPATLSGPPRLRLEDVRRIIRAHLEQVKGQDWDKVLYAFDTETDGFDGKLTALSLANDKMSGARLPAYCGSLWAKRDHPLAAHNMKFDLKVLKRSGLDLPEGLIFDTMIAGHLVDEHWMREKKLNLDWMSEHFLNRQLKSWEDVKDNENELLEYAAEDAEVCREIALILWHKLDEQGLLNYALKLEMPLIPIIAYMEQVGLKLDRELLAKRHKEFDNRLEALREDLEATLPFYDWTCQRDGCVNGTYHWKRADKTTVCRECEGTGQNLRVFNSDPQMREIIFDHLGLKSVKETDGGQPSLDKYAMPKLIAQADGAAKTFLKLYDEYGKIKKLHSTYYSPWHEADVSRLYSTVWQTGTVTGRWSNSDPNFQNIPPEAREVFVPDPGFKFVSCDYTQIELYLLGVMAGQDEIIEAYQNGEDLHERTAKIAGIDRDGGKTTNFALVYGLSPKSLADRMGISIGEAKSLYDEVHSYYSKLPEFRTESIRQAKERGYVTTLYGRRRRVRGIRSQDYRDRYHAENQAVNSRIQGSAADLIKAALIYTTLNVDDAFPMAQIHDEILYQVPASNADAIAKQIEEGFTKAVNNIEPRAEAEVLDRWQKT